jgi:eukaryotic-like serine/threonine-protein kinase
LDENLSSCDPTIAPDGTASPGVPPTDRGLPEMSHGVPSDGSSAGLASAADQSFPAIPNFKIVRLIGKGAMGRVYEALQENVQERAVAVKVISASAVDRHARALFKEEIALNSRLSHPHIVQIYDAGVTSEGRDFYAMELVKGAVPLDVYMCGRDMMRRGLLTIFAEVCRAVGHAHANEVIHCDIKPANILVGRDGKPHVLDFGLAMAVRSQEEASKSSATGSPFGSWPYMSPEQAAGDQKNLGPPTDVYSLGVTLYELLTGRYPYQFEPGSSAKQKAALIANSPILWDSLIKLDFELMAIIKKAMAKKPKERYASAKEMAEDVDNYLSGMPLLALWPHGTAYWLGKLARRRRWTVAAVLAALVALLAVATFAVVKSRSDLSAANTRQQIDEAGLAQTLDSDADLLAKDGKATEADFLRRQAELLREGKRLIAPNPDARQRRIQPAGQ